MATKRKRQRGTRGTGTIFQKPNGHWVAQLSQVGTDGKRERKGFIGATQTEALQRREDYKAKLATGETIIPRSTKTVGTCVREWFDDVRSPKLRQSTKELYKGLLDNHLDPCKLASVRLDKVSAADIEAWHKELRKPHGTKAKGGQPFPAAGSKTIRDAHVLVGAALRHAFAQGKLARNPLQGVESPTYSAPEAEYLTPEETKTFLDAARESEYFALFMLALDSGARQGELFGLKPEDFDFKRRTITIRRSLRSLDKAKGDGSSTVETATKTSASNRVVQISQATANSLREYRRKHTETIYLFSDNRGLPLRKDSLLLRKEFPAVLKRAKIKKPVTFHDLRHTAATRMLQVLPPHEVARRLGHSVDTLMKTYAHVMPQRASAAADDFDKLVGTG